ncbi:MAG: hypothetical protein OEN50_12920 [Deltaproteobacteria bacterium]|nr:hypothetical protein [Deltaproteobacteria bacterium]
MIDCCEREVHELHQFIERWLKGQLENTELRFARLEKSLSSEFIIVQPSGIAQDKQAVLRNFRTAYGTRDALFSIEIRNFKPLLVTDSVCVALYEEWHHGPESKGRVSTAVFKRHCIDQNLEWVHVHETIIEKRN